MTIELIEADMPASQENTKYTLEMNLNILNHLGINLYSNIPTVISEAVANAYDADAENVYITVEDGRIVIEDDGHGMTLEDINKKFLTVGYRKRNANERVTPKFTRPVMGRKGIGKLSLFSIADNVQVFSTKNDQKNGLLMYVPDIQRHIDLNEGTYHPQDIPQDTFEIEKGTRIVLTELRNSVTRATGNFLRRRLARRFSVIGPKFHFGISINGDPITIADRDYYKKLQFVWSVGTTDIDFSAFAQIKKKFAKDGLLDVGSDRYQINGWIGTVEVPSQLEDKEGSSNVSNNKISLSVRGKMAEEDILSNFKEARIFADYLIGELSADFLDLDDKPDISTSNRQQFHEFDPRYQHLLGYVSDILKEIGRVWTSERNTIATSMAFSRTPILKGWFDTLKNDDVVAAQSLFATIENIRLDDNADEKRKQLYAHGILAFERLKLRNRLSKLDLIDSAQALELSGIFADVDDIEATLFHDITTERINVIEKLENLSDSHAKERLLQQHIFDHLWLLDPSWERPTENRRMEQNIKNAFDAVDVKLSDEERKGRLDIKYREATGRHVIIELKKYERVVPVTDLTYQMGLYKSAAVKCLTSLGVTDTSVKLIAILGQKPTHSDEESISRILDAAGVQVLYYDELISNSLTSYKRYVQEHAKATKIKDLVEQLLSGNKPKSLPAPVEINASDPPDSVPVDETDTPLRVASESTGNPMSAEDDTAVVEVLVKPDPDSDELPVKLGGDI